MASMHTTGVKFPRSFFQTLSPDVVMTEPAEGQCLLQLQEWVFVRTRTRLRTGHVRKLFGDANADAS